LTFSGDYGSTVTVEVGMTEADFSGANLGLSGAMILSAWLEHKVQPTRISCCFGLINALLLQDMGSLVSLSLANNNLGVEGAKHVAEVLPKW
jgi:hypothetical protein